MNQIALLALVLSTGCSKHDTAASSAAPAGSAATPPSAVAESATTAPKVTPEMLFAPEPVWTVEALARGLWTRTNTGPVEHKCRSEFAMTWVQNGKVRAEAQKTTGATTCGPKAGFTVCTFTKPGGDPATEPKDVAHWVFTGTDAAPIMVAVLYGAFDDWSAIAPDLGKIEACPRPSQDPQ